MRRQRAYRSVKEGDVAKRKEYIITYIQAIDKFYPRNAVFDVVTYSSIIAFSSFLYVIY